MSPDPPLDGFLSSVLDSVRCGQAPAGRGDAQQLATAGQVPRAGAVAEPAVMADAVEPGGEDMEQDGSAG
jgi:hypothetical protein